MIQRNSPGNRGKYKVGIYTRESRDEKEENYETIETQRDLLIDFVKRNELGDICSIYMDDNVSGSAFEREGIEALNSDVRKGHINLLVVKDLSRLGRNNAQTLLFLDFLEEYGVRVLTFDGRYDSIKDNDTVGIETWFNERYIKDISKKIRTNLRFKIKNGEYLGHAPYGYNKSNKNKNRLVIDPQESQVVKEIYSLYLEGLGYSMIASTLNSKNYNSPSYKYSGISKGWNGVAIQRILSNRAYVGDTVQGVSEKISFKSKKTRRLPPEEWVVTKDTHEAIIDRKVFQDVQNIRKSKRPSVKTNRGTIHPLKGLVHCGRCGKVMYARKRKNRPMGYVCGTYTKKGKGACSSHYIREDIVLNLLKDELLYLIEDPQIFQAVEALKEECMRNKHKYKNLLGKLTRELTAKKRQQEIMYVDRLEGRISFELFEKINSSIEKKIQTISKRINEYNEYSKYDIESDNLSWNLGKIRQYLNKNRLTNRLIKVFVEKITVFDLEDIENLTRDSKIHRPIEEEYEDLIIIDFK